MQVRKRVQPPLGDVKACHVDTWQSIRNLMPCITRGIYCEFTSKRRVSECLDLAVCFRGRDRLFRRTTVRREFDSISSGRMGLYRLDYRIKGNQEYKGEHSPLHWKRGGLPGFGCQVCRE